MRDEGYGTREAVELLIPKGSGFLSPGPVRDERYGTREAVELLIPKGSGFLSPNPGADHKPAVAELEQRGAGQLPPSRRQCLSRPETSRQTSGRSLAPDQAVDASHRAIELSPLTELLTRAIELLSYRP